VARRRGGGDEGVMAGARAYAEGTSVSVEKTRAELDTLLTRSGAVSVGIATDGERNVAILAFVMKGARFRIEVPLPKRSDFGSNLSKFEQRTRERWRQLLLMLKAKLEVVRIGLSSVEREFMADMVLPNGNTVHHELADAIRRGLGSGESAPRMLGVGGEA
jgi:hypothetical protein